MRMLRSGGIMSPFPRPPSHSTGRSTTGLYRKRTDYTHTPSTSASASVLKRAAPTEVKVRVSQLRDWEGITRASLGVINHLDWFVASVFQVVNGLDINPEGKTDINNFLSSAYIAVNHLAHLQARNLASNATIRREEFLEASVLSREEAHYLRSQGIGCVDLLGVEGNEASLGGEAHVAALPVNGRRATSASTASHRSNVSLPPGTMARNRPRLTHSQ